MWIIFFKRDHTMDNILYFKPPFLDKFYCKIYYNDEIFYIQKPYLSVRKPYSENILNTFSLSE